MKVFISPTAAIGRGVEVFQNTLEESGITVVNPFLCKSFKEIKESFDTCDAMITFLCHQYAITSYTGDTVLSDAINKGMPVILIKEFPKQDRVGSLLIDEILKNSNVTVFDFTEGADIAALPDFVWKYVGNCIGNENIQSISERWKPDKPYTGNEPHIFVSYAHKDMRAVFEIIREMQNRGYRIWYDEGIDPASEWDQNIAEHVNSCSYLIAFISPNYIASQNCKDEISYARDLNKERLLVYLEDTKLPVGMAMRLMRLQAIHKYKYKVSSEFYDKLFSAQGIGIAR